MMSIDPDDDDDVAVAGIPNGNIQPRPFEPRQLEPRPFDPSRRSIMLDPETGLIGPGPDADASTPVRLPMVSNSVGSISFVFLLKNMLTCEEGLSVHVMKVMSLLCYFAVL